MTPVKIMERIRRALAADGRSSTEIGKAIGMDSVNVRQFKAGMRDLPLKSLCKLADVLGLEITVGEKPRRQKA